MYLMGIDIGGTKAEVVLLSCLESMETCIGGELSQSSFAAFDIQQRKRIKTNRLDGYAAFIKQLAQLCQDVVAEAQLTWQEIAWMGIGLPGAVDPVKQVMLIGNSAFIKDQDVAGDLRCMLNVSCPLFVANDANCFIWSEALCGAGKGFREYQSSLVSQDIAMGVILGTGVGGGCVWQGQLYAGRRGAACEFGHIVLESGGHPCYCGQEGCAEQYLSGPALEAAYASRIYSHLHERPSSQDIFDLQQKGDPIAIAIVKQYCRYLAKFLSILIQCFDPTYIVLGGGVSLQDEIYKDIVSNLSRQCFLKSQVPSVLQATLGDSSGVVGAALLGFQNVKGS